jgi:hypothetical protein
MVFSSWTKVLPKRGSHFDRAMEHLRGTGLPELALRYHQTFEKIFAFELSSLTSLAEQRLLFEAERLQCGNIGQIEDSHGYPEGASLTDIGIDPFMYVSGFADNGPMQNDFRHAEEYLG